MRRGVFQKSFGALKSSLEVVSLQEPLEALALGVSTLLVQGGNLLNERKGKRGGVLSSLDIESVALGIRVVPNWVVLIFVLKVFQPRCVLI